MVTRDEQQSMFTNKDKWKAPSDVTYYRTDKDRLMLVIRMQLPNKQWSNLVYMVRPEDEKRIDFSKAKNGGSVDDKRFNEEYHPNTVIEAGDAAELFAIEGPVGQYFTEQYRKFVGFNPVVEKNQGMAEVYAQALLEGWSDEQIAAEVKKTTWWQNASQEQREYQLLSPEQQEEKDEEMAGQLVHAYFDNVGRPIRATNKFIRNLATRTASGNISYGEALAEIQRRARKDPASPYSARVREIRRFDFNIENKIGDLRGLAHEWGVDLNDDRLERWATQIGDLRRSDEDYLEMIKGLAEAHWGSAEAGTSHRQRDTAVDEWAAPYMSSFTQLMERGSAATTDLLFDRDFRNLLSDSSMTVGQFENAIRSSEGWLSTNNGKRSLSETMAQVGGIFGYA